MMNFVLDDAEFCTKSLDEIAQFLKDRENTAIWYTDDCGLADIRFSPIDSEPLLAAGKLASLRSAPAMKFSASDEAYSDSIFAPSCGYFGSSQLLRVKGNIYPVGDSAIRGITRKLGLYDVHWNRMREFSPAKLSENLNNALDALNLRSEERFSMHNSCGRREGACLQRPQLCHLSYDGRDGYDAGVDSAPMP